MSTRIDRIDRIRAAAYRIRLNALEMGGLV